MSDRKRSRNHDERVDRKKHKDSKNDVEKLKKQDKNLNQDVQKLKHVETLKVAIYTVV